MTRAIAAVLWLALFAVPWLGPPTRPDALAWVQDLMTGEWADTEPWVVVHFMLMGVWPALLGLQLRGFWRGRPVPAGPFCAASFVVGAYGLLPWFVVRGAHPRSRALPRVEGLVGVLAGGAGVAALGLLVFGMVRGTPSAWWSAFRAEGFVWTMGFDFVVLWATSVLVARESGAGRWHWTLVPVLGTAALLVGGRRP